MRRPTVITVVLLCVAALAFGVLGTGAFGDTPAPALPSQARVTAIVCPERTSLIEPCCGPIVAQGASAAQAGATGSTGVTGPIVPCCPCCLAQAGRSTSSSRASIATLCCPPTAMCASPLTISSTPDPAPHGAAITISGLISRSSDPTVTLWQELAGQPKFTQLSTTQATADNTYSFKIPGGQATTDRDWYVTNGTQQSSTDDQLVEAEVTAAEVLEPSGDVVVSGQVTPGHAGDQVLIERRVGAQWNIVGKARLSRSSRFRAVVALHRAGRVALRVHLPADSVNTDSFSRTFSFILN